MQPIVGYNFGQGGFERVKKTITLSLGTTVIYGLLVCSICWLIPTTLIALLSKEPIIITQGQTALRIMVLACPLGGISVMVAAYFQSAGSAKEALMIALGGILLVKLPVLLLASRWFGLSGIWASEAVSELMLCIVALWMLRNFQEKVSANEHLIYNSRCESVINN
jgi:Na+-driven multidrug efflux pump